MRVCSHCGMEIRAGSLDDVAGMVTTPGRAFHAKCWAEVDAR